MGDHFFGCDICQDVCPWNRKTLHKLFSTKPSAPVATSKNSASVKENSTGESVKSKDSNPDANAWTTSTKESMTEELQWILSLSNKQLLRELHGLPLLRAGAKGLKRNALIVIGNEQITALQSSVEKYLSHPSLGELAQWAIDRIEESR